MTYILSCGCESKHGGFPSEWDSESRECEPAISYGSLCEKHFSEYEARPAQFEPRELSDEEIYLCAEETGMWCDGTPDAWDTEAIHNFARAILKKASEK